MDCFVLIYSECRILLLVNFCHYFFLLRVAKLTFGPVELHTVVGLSHLGAFRLGALTQANLFFVFKSVICL